jgi:hypothetical protein
MTKLVTLKNNFKPNWDSSSKNEPLQVLKWELECERILQNAHQLQKDRTIGTHELALNFRFQS